MMYYRQNLQTTVVCVIMQLTINAVWNANHGSHL